jgi:gluconolactonase
MTRHLGGFLPRWSLGGLVAALFAVASLLPQIVSATELKELVAPEAKATKIVGDCAFTEGPAWSPQGFLLFSDIPNERVVKVLPDGTSSDFLKPSGKANGLAFDALGRLYLCRGGARNMARIDNLETKDLTVLTAEFEGQPLNSPNDLALDPVGGLYFTDPYYGNDRGSLKQSVMGVYYLAADGKVTRVIDKLERPNGILVSADGKSLYVAEPNRRELYLYPITAPGQVGEGKVIFTGDEKEDGGGPDGMAFDIRGNLYATYGSVVVLSPSGELIGRIPVPERPANCKFGGTDNKTLYVTARTSLYAIPMLVEGAALMKQGPGAVKTAQATRAKTPVVLAGAEEPAKTKSVQAGDVKLEIPEGWEFKESTRQFRAGEIAVPPVEGDKEAGELVVFFFGQGGGGGVQANVERWVGQFEEKGRTLKLAKGKSKQGDYTLVELGGTYKKPVGPPFAMMSKTMLDWSMLGAIVETPNGNYFLKFDGPKKTIAASAEAFKKSFGYDPAAEKEVKPEGKE